MTAISVFSIKLGRLLLTCQRDSVHSYVLISAGFRAPMSFSMAEALADAARRIRWRAHKAVDGKMRPGPIFGLQLPDTKVTIGVTDDGRDIYCEVGDEHARLNGDELSAFMFALDQLGRDVSALYRATAAPDDMRWGIAAGLR
jgi:hypothetical protein